MKENKLPSAYWEYECLDDLPMINWKVTKFDKNGIPYSYIHRLDPSCPTLVEDGGFVEDLETFKLLFETRKERALHAARFFLNCADKLMEVLPEDGLDLIHKSILTCSKVSNEPIYQQILDKYGWNK